MVTDRKGRPVGGLTREDFVLLVDGQPVEITHFADLSELAIERASPLLTEGAPEGQSDSTNAAGTADGFLTLALFIDDSNLHPAFRARLLQRLKLAVEPWRSLDARFLLATFRDRLEILAPPSMELMALLAAIDALPAGSSRVLHQADGRRRALHRMADSDRFCRSAPFCRPCFDNWGDLLHYAVEFAYAEEHRVAVSNAGLADLVSTLAGLPGRKAVLHISDGLPQRPGISVFDYLGSQLCPERTSDAQKEMVLYEESAGFSRVAAHANANRVTFYTLDAAGLRGGLSTDPSFGARRYTPSARNDDVRNMNEQAGIFMLASETGGRMLANANDPVLVLPGVADELRQGYSLAFMPAETGSGRVRLIDVELVGAAAKRRRIRHRQSYRDKPLDERLAERLIAALYLGGAGSGGEDRDGSADPAGAVASSGAVDSSGGVLANPLRVRLSFDVTNPLDRKRHHELTVRIAVPRSAVFSVPAGDAEAPATGHLRVWLVAADRKTGARTGVRQKTLAFDSGGEVDVEGRDHEIAVSMDLPEAGYWLAVGVRDEATGATTMLRRSVNVPLNELERGTEKETGSGAASPPLDSLNGRN